MRARPKRRTDEEIRESMKTIKTKQVVRTQNVKSGDWYSLSQQFEDFAKKWNISWEEVKLTNSYWGSTVLSVKTDETEAEKFKRLRQDANRRYDNALYNWQREAEVERRRKAQEAYDAALNNPTPTKAKCCPSNCCCRK